MSNLVPNNKYKYDVPIIVTHNGNQLSGRLTVDRDPSGWDGKVFVHPELYMDMQQVSTELNGGFYHLSHRHFLEKVQLVFGFSGGVEFNFPTDDFEPFYRNVWEISVDDSETFECETTRPEDKFFDWEESK